jgi:hypothetical protein
MLNVSLIIHVTRLFHALCARYDARTRHFRLINTQTGALRCALTLTLPSQLRESVTASLSSTM